MHYSEPYVLGASSVGCLADLQPNWHWSGGCPCTAEAVSGCPGAQCCLESSWEALWPAQTHTPLFSPCIACRLRAPTGMRLGLSDNPLQLQLALFKFLSDARWRNNSSVKGKSPQGTELLGRWQALPLSTRGPAGPSGLWRSSCVAFAGSARLGQKGWSMLGPAWELL